MNGGNRGSKDIEDTCVVKNKKRKQKEKGKEKGKYWEIWNLKYMGLKYLYKLT